MHRLEASLQLIEKLYSEYFYTEDENYLENILKIRIKQNLRNLICDFIMLKRMKEETIIDEE